MEYRIRLLKMDLWKLEESGILGIDLKGSRCVVLDCGIDGKGLCAKGFSNRKSVYYPWMRSLQATPRKLFFDGYYGLSNFHFSDFVFKSVNLEKCVACYSSSNETFILIHHPPLKSFD